ncbi:MAG: LysE family transporter [Nanoarchaeota archaeon]|nr:LysE family transporter [Nanoarchaeota archaeon]
MTYSLLLGFSLAALPGPMLFELVRRSLTKGFFSGMLFSLGRFLAIFIILLFVFFGLSRLPPELDTILLMIGGIVLTAVGIHAVIIKKASRPKGLWDMSSLPLGFTMGLTSPVALAVWISIGSSFVARSGMVLIDIILVSIGYLLFFLAIALLVSRTRKRIPERFLLLASRVFGLVIFIYGLAILIELLTTITIPKL